jgi:hypothetical protein
LSVDEEVGKWFSEMEWGIEVLMLFVGEGSLAFLSCPFVWSTVVLLALFSC